MPPFSQSSFDLLHLQAAANTAKLKGRQVKQVKDSRSKNTDKTTKLLIVIVALFLAAEFPQVQNINNNNVYFNLCKLNFYVGIKCTECIGN